MMYEVRFDDGNAEEEERTKETGLKFNKLKLILASHGHQQGRQRQAIISSTEKHYVSLIQHTTAGSRDFACIVSAPYCTGTVPVPASKRIKQTTDSSTITPSPFGFQSHPPIPPNPKTLLLITTTA